MAQAILESLFAAFTPALYLRNASTINGNYNTFWESGAMTFTIVVIVVNLKVSSFAITILTSHCLQMMFVQTQWMPIHFIVIFLSIISWFCIAFIITAVDVLDYDWYQVS